jgi:hypothetical protein
LLDYTVEIVADLVVLAPGLAIKLGRNHPPLPHR